jgi:hypothetical protein
MRTRFEPEGDIPSVDILAGFVALWRESGSGALRAEHAASSARFDLADGDVVGVSSSDPRFDTAAILVRAGKLDPAALDRLVAPEGSDRALAALAAGILTKREWRWGEKIRAVEVLSREGPDALLAEFRAGISGMEFVYILRVERDAKEVRWRRVSGAFDDAGGRVTWLEGRRFRYENYLDPGFAVPGFAVRFVLERSLPRLIRELTDRAQARLARGGA